MSDWRPGEPITSRKLNAHSASRAQVDVSGPPGSFSKFGQNWAATQADLTNTGMWIRVTGNPVEDQYVISNDKIQKVKLHSWEAIYWNEGKKMWAANPAAYGNASRKCATVCDYDAVISPDFGKLEKTTDTSLAANNTNQTGVTPYFAVRDPVSRRLIAVNPSGGGNVEIKSGDTRLMILGTYDDYKDCEGVPPKPPTTWADSCGLTRTTTLCVPAYAYAVYQRCGYIWVKIGDTRTFQVWASETNGGSTGAWGRFHVPCWGGDRDPITWLPDPESACMGVTFEANGGSAISCSCPTWFTAITCLQITVKWIDEPACDPPADCSGCWDLMASRWGTQETIQIGNDMMGCVLQGDMGPFPINLLWTQYDWGGDCFWGPDEFDPCDPCTGFGKLVLSINSASRSSGGCANPAHAWMSWELKAKQLRDLICNCGTGPLRLSVASHALACGQLAEWVEISCCPGDTILGGDAFSSPSSGYSGGNSTTSYDALYGGEA